MTFASTTVTRSDAAATPTTRWGYLAVCVICMVMIANLQYGWTLFVNPINKAQGWSIASIQFAFAIFIALETWLTPIEGWIVDVLGPQRGPKLMVAFGGIMVAHRLGHQFLRRVARNALSRRRHLAASAAALSTRPASAWRSNGFRTGAGSPSV